MRLATVFVLNQELSRVVFYPTNDKMTKMSRVVIKMI